MKWIRIGPPRIAQPTKGRYSDWKPLLAVEGRQQCVYCAISEAQWGGTRNFHVEHYRPKRQFKDLRDTIDNLFYACSVCNGLKSDDWPGDPDPGLEKYAYPNPAEIDLSSVLRIDARFIVSGTTPASRYLVERLGLNRYFLVHARREAALSARIQVLLAIAADSPGDAAAQFHRLTALLIKLQKVPPYESSDLHRPKAKLAQGQTEKA